MTAQSAPAPLRTVRIGDIPDELQDEAPAAILPLRSADLLAVLEALRDLDRQRRDPGGAALFRSYLHELPDELLRTLEVLMYTGRELRDLPESAETGRWLLRAYALDSRAECRHALLSALHKLTAIEHIDRGVAFARQHAPEVLHRGARVLIGKATPRRRRCAA